MKDVMVIARFPEEQYNKKGEPMLEITGMGEGSSLAIAVNRAFRSVLQHPRMRHKSPSHIYLSIGIGGMYPIPFWHYARRQESETPKPDTESTPPEKR